jgi:hypothetical protein
VEIHILDINTVSRVNSYRRVKGLWCSHLQGHSVQEEQLSLQVKHYDPLRCGLLFTN